MLGRYFIDSGCLGLSSRSKFVFFVTGSYSTLINLLSLFDLVSRFQSTEIGLLGVWDFDESSYNFDRFFGVKTLC